MPRRARVFVNGLPYHVLNRGNRRQNIFAKEGDYETFLTTLADALERFPIAVLAFALMPNHFHLVLWPQESGNDISTFMRWLMNAHIRRHYRSNELWGTGHLYQGRYKAFAVQTDHHLLTVLRYVEANPLRARLVSRAEAWNWASLGRSTCQDGRRLLAASPVRRPDTWSEIVNQAFPPQTYQALQTSAQRQIPFGEPEWIRYISQVRINESSERGIESADASRA